MKRFTMIVALLLMVAMPMMAERVSPETARKVATTFLNNNGAKAAQLSDLSKAAGFPNLYIFTAEQGFVVMAADDCVQPILGYSLTDIFVTEDMPENLVWWLRGYNDEIQYAVDRKMKASNETTKMWKDLAEGNAKAGKTTVAVAPLIQTKWNQNKYYNRLCPEVSDGPDGHAYTGCVATAMAQIMKYWNYPLHGIGSVTYNSGGSQGYPYFPGLTANFGATTYDWDNMNPYYEKYYVNGEDLFVNELPDPTEEEINAIATLMYHCGVSVNMNYGGRTPGGSGAFTSDVATALINYFNYSSAIEYKRKSYTNLNTGTTTTYYSDSEWIAMLKVELDASRPLQYGGSDPNGSTGHAFVCDGYDNRDYFHFNWGWAGHYNGYFSISNLDTGANSGEAGAGNGNYTRNQEAVFGIQPKDCTASVPLNFNVVLEDRTAILTWNAASNAASYSIYRDGFLLVNTTSTTYTDSNLSYGTYTYYIKSRDANGAASSPTSTITVSIEPTASNLTVTKNGNDAVLNWSEPEWCVPQSDAEVLTYGDATGNKLCSLSVSSYQNFYWGHRYSTSELSNKVIYKVSFYAAATGNFALYIYKGSSASSSKPQSLIWNQSVEATSARWVDIVLPNPIQIDNTKDLWVFMYNQEAMDKPARGIEYSGNDGNFIAVNNPTASVQTWSGYAFLIRTYITDGSFTYNLFDNTTAMASNLSGNSYTISNIENNFAHQYTLKTNFASGLTGASNMAGLAIGTASLSTLQMTADDKMTITENSKLTVTGTLSDVNADNLILEDGAQLVNSSTGVQATVKKNITAYSQDGGWYLLASPMAESITPTVDNGILANDYDFFTFNQSEQLEWRNYKTHNFTFDNNTGYLYANSGNPTLSFAGTLVANTTATTLTYDDNADFKGFNLIGNPYPCNTYVDRSFYVMKEDGSDFTLGSNPIPPCTSIMVQAQGTGESVTFSKTASKNRPGIVATVKTMQGKGEEVIDKARVSFEENDNLTKFTMGQHPSQLYIPQDKQNYAVAFANGQSEMPLNFKAAKNGTYVLDFKVENMEANYLHLIDNMTRIDVDLLTTPSYVFEATTDDYEDRFRLMMTPICEDANGGNETFAYYANGEIHLVETQNFASLQIVDMTGRILVSRDMVRHISTANMAPGIYVLRLISGEQVKTQKIVLQ